MNSQCESDESVFKSDLCDADEPCSESSEVEAEEMNRKNLEGYGLETEALYRIGEEAKTEDCPSRESSEPAGNGSLSEPSSATDEPIKQKKKVRWADIEGEIDSCYDGTTEEEESSEEEVEEEETVQDKEVESSSEAEEEETEPAKTQENPNETGNESEEEEEEEEVEDDREESETRNPQADETSENDEKTLDIENMSFRDADRNQLYSQISELQRNLLAKTSGMERLQNELETLYNESEQARKRFRRLQDKLEACERCNRELTERLNKQTESARSMINEEQLKEAEERVKDLERRISLLREENTKLYNSLKKLEKEREEEMQLVQQALDDALNEQQEMEVKFGREFEQLRTVNSNRELKMIEDFEWKLREVQKGCKKQIQDKEREYERQITDLVNRLSLSEAELEKVAHLKVCEIELQQVRAASQEQKRNLRTLTRKYEELQVSEKILQEETSRLRIALDKEKANFSAIQTLHKEDLAEKERKLQFKLEIQNNRLNLEWDEKMKRECSKIKSDMERTFREEKKVAVDTAKQIKDQETSQQKAVWDKKVQDQLKEIGNLKRKLIEKDEQHKKELENAQTQSDRDTFELRRKMDKLDMNYQEQIEKLQEKHEKEISRITEEHERKTQQYENSLHMQAGTTRTTLELVKQQMIKEGDIKMQQLRDMHQKELEEQWHSFMLEKERALEELQEKHNAVVKHLQIEIAALSKSSGPKEEIATKLQHSGETAANYIKESPKQFKNKTETNLSMEEQIANEKTQSVRAGLNGETIKGSSSSSTKERKLVSKESGSSVSQLTKHHVDNQDLPTSNQRVTQIDGQKRNQQHSKHHKNKKSRSRKR